MKNSYLVTAPRHGPDVLRVLPQGARLPPIRQLARDLGVATATIARVFVSWNATRSSPPACDTAPSSWTRQPRQPRQSATSAWRRLLTASRSRHATRHRSRAGAPPGPASPGGPGPTRRPPMTTIRTSSAAHTTTGQPQHLRHFAGQTLGIGTDKCQVRSCAFAFDSVSTSALGWIGMVSCVALWQGRARQAHRQDVSHRRRGVIWPARSSSYRPG